MCRVFILYVYGDTPPSNAFVDEYRCIHGECAGVVRRKRHVQHKGLVLGDVWSEGWGGEVMMRRDFERNLVKEAHACRNDRHSLLTAATLLQLLLPCYSQSTAWSQTMRSRLSSAEMRRVSTFTEAVLCASVCGFSTSAIPNITRHRIRSPLTSQL